MKKFSVAGLVIAGCIFGGHSAHAQETSEAKSVEVLKNSTGLAAIMLGESSATLIGYDAEKYKGREIAGEKIAEGYTQAAKDAELSNAVIARTVMNFYASKSDAKGAAQVSQLADETMVRLATLTATQNQRIIQQNDKIIALLEQLVKKK